ncbi:protein kinase [Geminocystis sp.]|uniref:protein kinase domain-containing protein n=1 Tax=Geminocystis sp. TaxID=2664100 RepID=UPI0035939216
MDHTPTQNKLPPPYRMIKQIGRGSFGSVYLVVNETTNNQCVVKQLHPISNQPSFISHARRLFRQEAEILKKLTHPQIPHLIDYFEEGEEFYLVEEYIEGHTLRQELIPNQPWQEEQVINLLYDGLSILGDIHSQGIIHRDVKPDNFLRRHGDNKLVLIDFGAVKEFKIEQSRLVDPTVAMGTRGYMPTEQARGKPYKNSDIYALGIIAIQALTGVNPMDFEEDEEGEIIWQCEQINPVFRAILAKMTRYHFKKRYPSAQSVMEDLDIYQQQKNQHNNVNPTEKIESSPTMVTNNQLPQNSDKIKDWFKSSVGSTITTALIIGLVATGGAYYINFKEKAHQKQIEQELVKQLEEKSKNKAYQECFEEIETKKTENDSAITPKALEYIGICRLGEAQKQADLFNYVSALEIIAQIPKNDPNFNQAQIFIKNWSTAVFEKAQNLYKEEGKLEDALKEIDTIPDGEIRQAGLINASKWKEENQTNSNIIQQAQRDLEYSNCQEAIETVSQLQGSNYWLLQGKKIVDDAKKCLEEKQKNSNVNNNNSNSNNKTNNTNNKPSKDDKVIDICRDSPLLCQ